MIGLADDGAVYEQRGYGSVAMTQTYAKFSRNFGMPVTGDIRKRPLATWPACKVVVATRLIAPEREAAVQRALQVAWFTTVANLEEDDELIGAISCVPDIDPAKLIAAASTSDEVDAAFAADRRKARGAAGSPTQAQGKHAMDGDQVRYTAPSLLMEDRDGRPLEAGGFQPVEAYDVIIANADPTLSRNAPEGALEVLKASEWALCTAEVATVLAEPFTPRDDAAVEAEMIALAGAGKVIRMQAGNGAFWSPAV